MFARTPEYFLWNGIFFNEIVKVNANAPRVTNSQRAVEIIQQYKGGFQVLIASPRWVNVTRKCLRGNSFSSRFSNTDYSKTE